MHRRRRTAITASTALLIATPLLAACGEEARPGAAALIGGQRVEVSTVQAAAKDVRAAQARSPQAAQLIKDSGQLSRAKLYDIIVDRVVDRAAQDAGVRVSRKEIQQTRGGLVQQSGGEQQLEAAYLQERGVAPDRIDDAIRREIQISKLAESVGASGAPDGQEKLNRAFVAAAKALDIDVNPRFGQWKDQQLELGDYKAPWIKQITKQPQPQPQPQPAQPGGA
ncbi:SurA N-terminal domain-containing protein [Streptomyces yaizuensis]|uniref:SurA N-terminal domain-containing protein n=1 Tax=Streptomyces yaizuensis TaxID=2989713 RepID=A0ABQ5P9S3_9ACTN|nr:SurA N-terminal domain-containing protein [Streptomyces sp. YSPA8]GLF99340.1 SurA N-terminal domain-containing protein [Streptomyces sp. YSPA8]